MRVRLLLASVNPAADGFHCGAVTVLAQISVLVASLEQRIGHDFLVNPVARNHPSKVEGHGIERFVTLAVRGGTEFGGGTVERYCGISFAAGTVGCFRSRASVRLPVRADDSC